jgi:preprotein translocase subunit SecE
VKGIANFFRKISKFFKDLKSELKKVVWPTISQLVNNTGIVLIFILIVGVSVWLLDALFAWGISFIS